MKNKILVILFTLFISKAFSQITAAGLQQFFTDKTGSSQVPGLHLTEIKRFYELLEFKTAWIKKENEENCRILLNELKHAVDRGLQPADYPIDYIDSICKGEVYLPDTADSLAAEMKITDAAIRFYIDRVYGNTIPSFGYNGLNYMPDCQDIPLLLGEHLFKNLLPVLNVRFLESLPEVPVLEIKIRFIHSIISDGSFKEILIRSDKVDISNQPLINKLYQLGHIDSISNVLSTAQIKKAVQQAQREFGLIADGVLRPTLMKELNIPLSMRFQQLNLSINYYRWLYCLSRTQAVIVVNIPAAYMKVYKNGKVILEMRMVLGKPSTPTPTLASKVSDVVLYPYWHVPYSIATKELLPRIKQSPAFIDAGNYQVLDRSGKIINPYKVNWQELSTKNFPYIIRQSTGCDNALGLLKLNFYSPFGVYLHDTPLKSAFILNKRYFSHGCLRMENPMGLGRLVLKNNTVALDTLEEKGCLRHQSPIIVQAEEKMPVIVWYNPAGVDSTGRLLFYEDVYKKMTGTMYGKR